LSLPHRALQEEADPILVFGATFGPAKGGIDALTIGNRFQFIIAKQSTSGLM
jgi:hypothetical protein